MKSFAMFRLNCEVEELGNQLYFLNEAIERFAPAAEKMRGSRRQRIRDAIFRFFDWLGEDG